MRYFFLLVFLATLLSAPIFAQSEAQSVEEVLRFESQKSKRKVDVSESDFVKIKYPIDGGPVFKGKVSEIQDNGFEVVNQRTGAAYYVDLEREKSFVHRNDSGMHTAGLVLSILGYLGTGIFFVLAIVFALIAAFGGGSAALVGALVGLLTSFLLMFLGIGFLIGSSRHIRIKDWKWRRIRKIFVPSRP